MIARIYIILAAVVSFAACDRGQAVVDTTLPDDHSEIHAPATREIDAVERGARVTSATVVAGSFGCRGAYSNVEFSSESGDGSGVFLRIRSDRDVTFHSWEGGVFKARTKVLSDTHDRLNLELSFEEFANDSSELTLVCQDGILSMNGQNWGNSVLRRLSAQEASEMEG